MQLYYQRSDQSAFTGFDDGSGEKTINLTTKKDKRKEIFGQNTLGVGTNERYQARLNFNRFNHGQQVSVLGMGNNINQQGFTIQDMFSFGSGLQGGGDNMPVAVGGRNGGAVIVTPGWAGSRPGIKACGGNNSITESCAGGVNYRDSWSKKVDVNGSFFVNHSNVLTDQKSLRQNILPDTSFLGD